MPTETIVPPRLDDREVMSNFDHEIHEDVAELLLDGKHSAEYPAWNFHGDVFFDAETSEWVCVVMCYHERQDDIRAGTLQEVMDEACARHGDE